VCQVLFYPLPFGKEFGYVPKGPLAARTLHKEDVIKKILPVASKRTIFLELELARPIDGLLTKEETRQPRSVAVVFIENATKETLYERFHSTLKENLRRAQRTALAIRREEHWGEFHKLYEKSSREKKLRPWPARYVETMWNRLTSRGMLEIWSAYYGDRLLASNLYILFGSRVTHLFGASSSKVEDRQFMAPHFLHWHMMADFSLRGFTAYDLGGVDPVKWPGLTSFKTRFGAVVETAPGTAVLVQKPLWYFFYRAARRMQ
jgi:lipid II:glycine glycyltransferase (peptidoglycan interpeptide bridge formation enzyme)